MGILQRVSLLACMSAWAYQYSLAWAHMQMEAFGRALHSHMMCHLTASGQSRFQASLVYVLAVPS